MNIGVGYAIWAGLGVILVAAIGTIWFKEKLTKVQLIGIGCIIGGVAALELGAHM
jgi:small multidrug resistance pump